MQHFSTTDIKDWGRFYRANFINCLSGYKPVSLIGTVNEAGLFNLAVFSNIVHIGADPAIIGFINRPLEAAPHTIANIKATGQYTINHINPAFVAQAHQTSAKYPDGISEFEATGLTPVIRDGCTAPFVKESTVQYALQLAEIIPLTINKTFLVTGYVTHICLQEGIVKEDGFIELDKAGSIVSAGIDGYAAVTPQTRLQYAKPGETPKQL